MTVLRRRSLPDRLRYYADELEVAGEAVRLAIAVGLRMTAEELDPLAPPQDEP